MGQNFDFVTMDDYRSDMQESASHAAAVIYEMKRGKREAERALIAAVLAAGGKITVHSGHLDDAATATLTMERNEYDDTLILTARR